ncbi:MAG: MarR family transcriptional regulator [Elusimicrobiota bacterium]|jgi:DNA-binding MarR family transcriptional regulator|nr:MarR family transcriptional regulator [Elusimicrobiota bacterium]
MDIARDLFFAQQAIMAWFAVTNKLQMHGDKYLEDLTVRQMLAIPTIFHAPDGKATINHIARQLGTTKQSAKQIVDALEKKKYLSVARNERDKRAVNVSITKEGHRALRLCSKLLDEFLADIFREFTTEDLEKLCEFLKKLYRFDGSEQEGIEEHVNYDAAKADDTLKYHQNFLKKRRDNRA